MADTNENLRQEAFVKILKAREKLYADLAVLLKEHGLTEPQYNVLRIIRGAGPDGLPCLQVGKRMITRVPDITRLLDRLGAEGYVTRTRGDQDRRVVTSRLTEKGRDLLAKLDEPVRAAHERQFTGLSDEQLVEIVDLMDKVIIS